MRWQVLYSSTSAALVEAHIERGIDPPDHLVQPTLIEGAGFYLEAYFELLTETLGGMGLRPIPFTALDCYARRYGIEDNDEFDMFRTLMRAMEREHADLQRQPETEPT